LNRPICVVTGASGALGPIVVREFGDAGFTVRALTRAAAPDSTFPDGTEIVVGDILEPETLERAMSGADTVVHLAALLHVLNPAPAMASEYQRVNVEGTRNVLESAFRAGVRSVVVASTIAVYGPTSDKVLDETSEPDPDTYYAKSKLESERVSLLAVDRAGQPLAVVLRFGAIYGSRMKGNYRRLMGALQRGAFVRVGSGTNRRTLIHERDAARAVLLASRHPAAPGQVFNVTDGSWHTLNEIVSSIAEALGKPIRRIVLPLWPVRVAAAVIELVVGLTGRRSPVGRATIDKFVEDVAIDGSRMIRELGFAPRYDLAAGWRDTVATIRASASRGR